MATQIDIGTSLDFAFEIDEHFRHFEFRDDATTHQQIEGLYANIQRELDIPARIQERFGVSWAEFFDFWRMTERERNLLVPWISRSVEVRVKPGLSEVTYLWNGQEHTISNPEVMWPCNCWHKPYRKPPQSSEEYPKCKIHSIPGIATLEAKFHYGPVRTRYQEELDLIWHNTPGLWPPTIDPIKLIEAMRADGVDKKSLKTALDIGCGTGILGTWFAKSNPQIEKVHFVDWFMTPLFFSAMNWGINIGQSETQRATYSQGYKTASLKDLAKDGKIDVAVCNPPYLPRFPDERKALTDSTVAGTELLEDFVRDAPRYVKNAYVNFSHLAMPEVEKVLKEHGRKLIPLSVESVPINIPHAFEDPDYMELLKSRGMEVRDLKTSYYPLYHELGMYRIE